MKKILCDKSGSSILNALVLMVVVLVLGGALFGASGAALSAQRMRMDETQIYLDARSAAEVFTSAFTSSIAKEKHEIIKTEIPPDEDEDPDNPAPLEYETTETITLESEGVFGVLVNGISSGEIAGMFELSVSGLGVTVTVSPEIGGRTLIVCFKATDSKLSSTLYAEYTLLSRSEFIVDDPNGSYDIIYRFELIEYRDVR